MTKGAPPRPVQKREGVQTGRTDVAGLGRGEGGCLQALPCSAPALETGEQCLSPEGVGVACSELRGARRSIIHKQEALGRHGMKRGSRSRIWRDARGRGA